MELKEFSPCFSGGSGEERIGKDAGVIMQFLPREVHVGIMTIILSSPHHLKCFFLPDAVVID